MVFTEYLLSFFDLYHWKSIPLLWPFVCTVCVYFWPVRVYNVNTIIPHTHTQTHIHTLTNTHTHTHTNTRYHGPPGQAQGKNVSAKLLGPGQPLPFNTGPQLSGRTGTYMYMSPVCVYLWSSFVFYMSCHHWMTCVCVCLFYVHTCHVRVHCAQLSSARVVVLILTNLVCRFYDSIRLCCFWSYRQQRLQCPYAFQCCICLCAFIEERS